MKQLLAVLSLAILLTPFAKAQNGITPLPFQPSSAADAFGSAHVVSATELNDMLHLAARLPDSLKAERYNEILISDTLHFQLIAYTSDKRYAVSETKELKDLSDDLDAIDAVRFPSVDTTYPDLVEKATKDFQKLYDKDQKLQNAPQV
jgi:hypothetical protein